MTPAWILDLLAALMLVVAAVSAARLVAARPWQQGSVIVDTDIAHLLMAIAMAGMLVSSLQTLPEYRMGGHLRCDDRLVRLPGRARRPGERGPRPGRRALRAAPRAQRRHALHVPGHDGFFRRQRRAWQECRARASSMMMMSDPTLAFVFALVLIGYSIWDLDQLSGRRYSLASARVSLAGVRAGVPAMAGAESATRRRSPGRFPRMPIWRPSRTPPPDQAPSVAMRSPATPPPSAEVTSSAVLSVSSCCRQRSRSAAG